MYIHMYRIFTHPSTHTPLPFTPTHYPHNQLPADLVLQLVADGLVYDGINKVGDKTKDGRLLRVAGQLTGDGIA